MFKFALLALVALFGSSDALKAPLGKLGQSRVAAPFAKAGALAAIPAVFSAAPAWAKVRRAGRSPRGARSARAQPLGHASGVCVSYSASRLPSHAARARLYSLSMPPFAPKQDAALSVSPYGTGGEGTGDSLGINDSSLLGVLLGVFGLIFTLYISNASSLPDEDFFDGIDDRR